MPVADRFRAQLAQLSRPALRVYDTGLLHLVGMVIFVQGLAYIMQLWLARLLSPAEFGIVRSVESVLSVLVAVGSVGMPTLTIKTIATVEPNLRGPLLRRLARLAMLASGVSAGLAALAAQWYLTRAAQPYLTALIWCGVLVAASRTLINYFLAIKQVQQMALASIVLSLIAMSVMLIAVAVAGLPGWVLGRYLGEGLFLAGGLWLVRGALAFDGALPNAYRSQSLLVEGLLTAASLGVRSVLDTAGVLALGYWNRPAAELGHYGLSSLIVMAGLIIPGAISNLALPRLVEKRFQPKVATAYFGRVLLLGLGVTIVCAGAIIAVSALLPWIYGTEYAPASTFLNVLALGLPLRAVSTIASSQLLAHNHVHISTLVNIVLMGVIFGLFAFAIPVYGAMGAAWVTVGVEAASALIYWLAALRITR